MTNNQHQPDGDGLLQGERGTKANQSRDVDPNMIFQTRNGAEGADAEQMVREGRAITVIIPIGYDSAWDFLHDCGLEAVYPAAPSKPAERLREASHELAREANTRPLTAAEAADSSRRST